MRSILIFLAIAFVSIKTPAQVSKIEFSIKNLGINVTGSFDDFYINAYFDNNFKLDSIYSSIRSKSINTGIKSRDRHLLGDTYFQVEKHPRIILNSTQINQIDANHYDVLVEIQIKDFRVVKQIPVLVKKVKNTFQISSNFLINRKKFNIGGGSLIMGKTVMVDVFHEHTN